MKEQKDWIVTIIPIYEHPLNGIVKIDEDFFVDAIF